MVKPSPPPVIPDSAKKATRQAKAKNVRVPYGSTQRSLALPSSERQLESITGGRGPCAGSKQGERRGRRPHASLRPDPNPRRR